MNSQTLETVNWQAQSRSFVREKPHDTLLDNIRNNLPNSAETTEKHKGLVKSNNRHAYKISRKFKQQIDLSKQIAEYLKTIGLDITHFKKYKEVGKSCIDFSTGEVLNEAYAENQRLIHYYFELRKRGAFLKQFKKSGKTQIRNAIYSRHRLCAVANYLKYKRLSKIWRGYMQTNFEKLQEHTPLHVVLTVPHKEGVWNGKTFFAVDLIKKFQQLRNKTKCKKYFAGGEYNCENKQSPNGNGIHSHLHILCFMPKQYSINEAREEIVNEWQRLTGGFMVHCESLYYKEKVVHQYAENLQDWQKTEKWQKRYISSNSTAQDWEKGMLECLKYHFKSDDYVQKELSPNGNYITKKIGKTVQYDISLIKTILDNTENVNLYGRFGFCYNDTTLNLNHKKDDAPAPSEADTQASGEGEEVTMGKIENGEAYSVNPETLEKLEDNDFTLLYCTRPETLFYFHKWHKTRAFEPKKIKDIMREKYIYEVNELLSVPQQMSLVSKGDFFGLLTLESYQKYQKEELAGV